MQEEREGPSHSSSVAASNQKLVAVFAEFLLEHQPSDDGKARKPIQPNSRSPSSCPMASISSHQESMSGSTSSCDSWSCSPVHWLPVSLSRQSCWPFHFVRRPSTMDRKGNVASFTCHSSSRFLKAVGPLEFPNHMALQNQ